MFVRGTDNALWHKWQTAPNSGWSGWSSLGGVITTDPALGRNRSGRLEVFARGTDNALWHKWQTAPNSGWSGWASRGGILTSEPAVASNADGRIEVFVRGTDNALWHQWQNQPFLTEDEAMAGSAAGTDTATAQPPGPRGHDEDMRADMAATGDMPVGAMVTGEAPAVIDLDRMPAEVMPEPAEPAASTADAQGRDGGGEMPVPAMTTPEESRERSSV